MQQNGTNFTHDISLFTDNKFMQTIDQSLSAIKQNEIHTNTTYS